MTRKPSTVLAAAAALAAAVLGCDPNPTAPTAPPRPASAPAAAPKVEKPTPGAKTQPLTQPPAELD
jgi:hypothetical protein